MATFGSAYLTESNTTVEITSVSAATAYIEYLNLTNLLEEPSQYRIYYTDSNSTYDETSNYFIIRNGYLQPLETLRLSKEDFPEGKSGDSFFGNDASNYRLYVQSYTAAAQIHVLYKRLDVADLVVSTSFSTEELQDLVGDMVDGGTETNITVTYDDTNGKLNFVSTNTQLPLIDDDTMATASSTNVASAESVKAYVDAEVSGIVDSAPGTLDTLNELAAALGDDANFSTTVTNNIATKAPIASPTFTGTVAIPNIADLESAVTANTAKTSFPGFGTSAGTALEGDTTIPSYSVMGSGNSYAAGLVPAGIALGDEYLRRDGTWSMPYIYMGMDGISLSTNQIAVDLKANGGLVIESGKIALDLGALSITNASTYVHSTTFHHFIHSGFFMSYPYSRYIPLNGSINEQTTSTLAPEYTTFIWPYDGYVKTIWVRSETSLGDTEMKLYKGTNGNTVSTAAGYLTESVGANTSVEFDMITDATGSVAFNQGEAMAIRIDPTDDPDSGQNVTIELVFNLTT